MERKQIAISSELFELWVFVRARVWAVRFDGPPLRNNQMYN